MNVSEMQASAGRAADLMRLLSNETRLMLLCQLLDGERSVGDLAKAVGARQAAVSQQLSLLRRDGTVETRRDGQTIYYSLARDEVRRVIQTLYEVFCS